MVPTIILILSRRKPQKTRAQLFKNSRDVAVKKMQFAGGAHAFEQKKGKQHKGLEKAS